MARGNPAERLVELLEAIERAGIAYALTGSGAGLLYGLSRATVDFDVLVDLAPGDVDAFVRACGEGYYLDREAIIEAVRRQTMFNIIPLAGGTKVDIIVVSGDAFEQAKFRRRRRARWMDASVWVVTAADLVISKLRWAKESQSARHLADVRAIMAAGQVEEDDEFRHWIATLGLQQALDASREARYDA